MTTDSKPGYAEALSELDSILRELESSDVDVDRLAERVARAAELIAPVPRPHLDRADSHRRGDRRSRQRPRAHRDPRTRSLGVVPVDAPASLRPIADRVVRRLEQFLDPRAGAVGGVRRRSAASRWPRSGDSCCLGRQAAAPGVLPLGVRRAAAATPTIRSSPTPAPRSS